MSLPTRQDQIHSYHPPIASNGLYWTLSVPPEALRVDADATAISIELRDVALVDEPLAPLPGPGPFDARVSLKVTWLRRGFFVGWTDPTAQFHLRSAPARAMLEFEASTPSLNFYFKSDPGPTSETIFAIIGTEQNGVFF